MADDIKTDQVTFQKNGDLLLEEAEGTKTLIANYDRKTGRLEFINREYSAKHMRKVTAAIGTIDKGMKSSGLSINSMGIKGEKADAPVGKVPVKPKRDPQFGDQTPALVKWYFDYYPQEAYLRYGVFLDTDGNPIRRTVRRKTTEIVDDRSGEYGIHDPESKGEKAGTKTWENGPILKRAYLDTLDNQIVARRATCMTYAPVEVVGGFEQGDEEQAQDGQEQEESNE